MDEAGYTGPDLVNRDQPVFILASTIISEVEAEQLLNECFSLARPAEVKHSRLSKSRRGRSQILELIRHLTGGTRKIAFYGVHKEYVLLAFLIDFWLEPMLYEDGVNLYERGANIGLANVSYITLGATLGPEGRRELLRRFQVMTRDRTTFSFNSFWESFDRAVREHELIGKALGPLLLAEQRLGYRHLLDLPSDLLDLGDYGLIETIKFWREELPDCDFVLVHDNSAMIKRNHARWEAVLDPTNPTAMVGQDRRTISFPLPVRGIHIEDSHLFPQLQVVDVVAGAAYTLLDAKVTATRSEYIDALDESGILSAASGGVWPSDLITPKQLETDGPVLADVADFIAGLIHNHQDR